MDARVSEGVAVPPALPGFEAGAAWVDGAFVPVGEASVPLLDWGFMRGDVTYDTVHVWRDRFFRLDDHLDRFERNVGRLRMSLPVEREALRDILHGCVARAGLRDAYVQMACTRGLPAPGSRDPRTCTNRLYCFAVPFIWIASPEQQARGLHLVISGVRRIPPGSVDPQVKNYHWLDLMAALREAQAQGGESAVLQDGAGHLTEGPGFNLFLVARGGLVTPAAGVLDGITRRTVLELAGELGLPVEERPVPVEEARAADEIFLSSTAGGVMPVTVLDGEPVGEGRPGPVTGRLREAYWQAHRRQGLAEPVRREP